MAKATVRFTHQAADGLHSAIIQATKPETQRPRGRNWTAPPLRQMLTAASGRDPFEPRSDMAAVLYWRLPEHTPTNQVRCRGFAAYLKRAEPPGLGGLPDNRIPAGPTSADQVQVLTGLRSGPHGQAAMPGRHLSGPYLAARLAARGLYARQARNTALTAFASDLPAPVIADLLGMRINTALTWG